MVDVVEQYLPHTWDDYSHGLVDVYSNDDEWDKVEKDFNKWGFDIVTLSRHQDKLQYGKFLLRQQYMAIKYGSQKVYRVKRYVGVDEEDYDCALDYNLDARRCINDINFDTHIAYDHYIFVVVCLTTDHAGEFVPNKSTDYYIEYVATIE